jgi:hypothetical protein
MSPRIWYTPVMRVYAVDAIQILQTTITPRDQPDENGNYKLDHSHITSETFHALLEGRVREPLIPRARSEFVRYPSSLRPGQPDMSWMKLLAPTGVVPILGNGGLPSSSAKLPVAVRWPRPMTDSEAASALRHRFRIGIWSTEVVAASFLAQASSFAPGDLAVLLEHVSSTGYLLFNLNRMPHNPLFPYLEDFVAHRKRRLMALSSPISFEGAPEHLPIEASDDEHPRPLGPGDPGAPQVEPMEILQAPRDQRKDRRQRRKKRKRKKKKKQEEERDTRLAPQQQQKKSTAQRGGRSTRRRD